MIHWMRRGSSRLYVPRGFAEGEAWATRGQFVPRRYFSMLVNSHRFGGGGGSFSSTYYLDTDAAGGGDGSIGTPWNTLQSAIAGLYAINTSFVSASAAPALVCTGATDDTTAVTSPWPIASTSYYLTIKAPDANRTGVWNNSRYTYTRAVANGAALSLSSNSIRLLGIQVRNTDGTAGRIIEITALGGEFVADGLLTWGVNGGGSVGYYARTAGIGGKIILRNGLNIDTQHGMLLGGAGGVELLSGSEVYVYNFTIWGSGFGGEGCNVYFESTGSGRVARVKNMIMYAQANGVTITNADTSDTATNDHSSGTPTSHFVAAGAPGDWRLVSSSSNVDAGTDLSAVGAGQWQFSEDVSLYTRPYNGTWDRGFHEYRP